MPLNNRSINQLSAFLKKIEGETYPELPSQMHTYITESVLDELLKVISLPGDAKILDVGCGQGPALEYFTKHNYSAIGITLNDEDVAVCQSKGFTVLKMDQSFLDFDDNFFHFIWARHCIEHSIFPFFTLWQFNRVLAEGGYLYVEVPAPDTSSHHETNPNHYSVLTKSAWLSLLTRSGLKIVYESTIPIKLDDARDDEYYYFVCQKVEDIVLP
ncbi:MAG: class I SAM-dependent methyltransferase [Ignavibacteriales bacterium]|nr:class I SAM-dependent methyltransferase [Ignavibacteriales bacterium]